MLISKEDVACLTVENFPHCVEDLNPEGYNPTIYITSVISDLRRSAEKLDPWISEFWLTPDREDEMADMLWSKDIPGLIQAFWEYAKLENQF